ncbi:MAG: uracil-DNA glycosylase [Alphaproteobacteria bacterium]|nr:uracil-DNA glycosylase [Alphaproteobacteria bacterium]
MDIPIEPAADCALCPRLAQFRAENRGAHPDWHNRPVPAFGETKARLLIVGLAPGLRGANATGRPFTGDFAGELLYPTLLATGFAKGTYGARRNDGLRLTDARITNAVRCVPPQNRPLGPEVRVCGSYLEREIAAMDRLGCIVTLGTVAHGSTLKALGIRPKQAPFGHGAAFETSKGVLILSSYHCSRLNTNTGRLTPKMFRLIFDQARVYLDLRRAAARGQGRRT